MAREGTKRLRVLATIAGGILLAGGCILLLAVPITKQDSSTGDVLRCGTAAFGDDLAANEYRSKRFEREAKSAFLDLGVSAQSPPPNSNHKPAVPALPGLAIEPPGSGSLSFAFGQRDDLTLSCDRGRGTIRAWSSALILAGTVLVIVGTFGLRLLGLSKGARLPTWMRTCPEWAQAALVTASGLTGGFAGIATGRSRLIWIALTMAIFVLAVLISFARSAEGARRDRQLSDLMEAHKKETQNLLGNELHSLVQLTAEAVATDDRVERCAATRATRYALISATAHLVGTVGTRANLFELSDDKTIMNLASGGFAGRGTRSQRRFRAGDKTFDLAMVEQGRFVKSAKEELVGDERSVPYQTFMTYPVSVGPGRVHGVLTVDSLNSGDLDQDRDMPIMAVLSALMAVTYECEKYQNPLL